MAEVGARVHYRSPIRIPSRHRHPIPSWSWSRSLIRRSLCTSYSTRGLCATRTSSRRPRLRTRVRCTARHRSTRCPTRRTRTRTSDAASGPCRRTDGPRAPRWPSSTRAVARSSLNSLRSETSSRLLNPKLLKAMRMRCGLRLRLIVGGEAVGIAFGSPVEAAQILFLRIWTRVLSRPVISKRSFHCTVHIHVV